MSTASEHEPLVLMTMVRAVAEMAAPENPRGVSTRDWDAARALTIDWTDAPSARRITEHLGLSWARVKELAFMNTDGQLIALGHAFGSGQQRWLTKEQAAYALRVVAERLGARTLSPGDYRRELAVLLAQAGPRARLGLRLPTDTQVRVLFRSWDRALAYAALAPRPTGRGARASVALTVQQVLDRCLEGHGTEPTGEELEIFARANGLPMQRRSRTWAEDIASWKQARKEAGLPVPDGPPLLRLRPNYAMPVGAARAGEVRARRPRGQTRVILAVADYLTQLRPGERSTQLGYGDWATRNPGIPSAASLGPHGGWSAIRELARRYLRDGTLPEEPPRAPKPPASPRTAGTVRGERRLRGERRDSGPKPKVSVHQLVERGLLRPDEPLLAAYKGKQFTATIDHDTGVVSVDGVGQFGTLAAAARHCCDGTVVGGLVFWRVERGGVRVPLNRLADLPPEVVHDT